jgi:hypothetical protein
MLLDASPSKQKAKLDDKFYNDLEENPSVADYFFVVGVNEQHLG